MLATCTSLEQLLPLVSTLVDSAQCQRVLPTSPSTRLFDAEQLHHLVPKLSMLPLMPPVVLSLVLLVRDTLVVLARLVFSSQRLKLRDMSPVATQTNATPETSVSIIISISARASAIMVVLLILSLSNGLFHLSHCSSFVDFTNNIVNSTSTVAPYCNTISFPGNIMDVFCNNVNITGIQAALTTYRGESSRTFLPLTLTGNAPASTTSDASTSAGTTSSPSPSASGTGGSGGSGDNGSSGDNDNGSKNGGGSKSNTGAIVGGVVGGVGGLALIGLAVFFFLRRKNSAAAGHEPVSQNAPPPVVYPAQGMQQNQQTYYDPKYAAATGQQPYPPNQQYGQQGFYPPQPSVSPDQTMSPNGSHIDPRYSLAPSSTSPAPSGGYAAPVAGGFQPQENIIHEVPAGSSDNHRGEMHELA